MTLHCAARLGVFFVALSGRPCLAADSPSNPLPAPPAARDELGKRFALSLYHWNIQYVSGSRKTEDAIVEQSFEPLLDLYDRHPNWHATFELQGYMIEVLEQRRPDVLEKLRRLVDLGRIEIVSVHYSDQLVVAFPLADELKSLEINDQVFARNKIRVSPVIFLQEDQFGEGIADVLASHGRTIAVNMGGWDDFSYDPMAPYYQFRDVSLVKINNYNPKGPQWVFGTGGADAEMAVTGHISKKSPILAGASYNNPYFTYMGLDFLFKKDPASIRALEEKMARLEADHSIVTIEEYVRALKAAAVVPQPTGPILDKVRSHGSTNSVWLWMGDNTFKDDDVRVLSSLSRNRREVIAAESMLKFAKESLGVDDPALRSRLEQAWKLQLMAEVSDCCGMRTPVALEREESLRNGNAAAAISRGIMEELKARTGMGKVRIDTKEETARPIDRLPEAEAVVAAEDRGPITVRVTGPNIAKKPQWRRSGKNRWELAVEFWPWLPGVPYLLRFNTTRVRFARTTDQVIYSPALKESEIKRYPLSQFKVDDLYLPLSNGLIGLGDDLYLIKHNATNHVAVHIDRKSNEISFDMRNAPGWKSYRWEFTLIRGTEQQALEAADRLNVHPILDR